MHRPHVLRIVAAVALAAALVLAPLSASARTVTSVVKPRLSLTMKQVQAKGAGAAVRALSFEDGVAEGWIAGHVGHDGGMYEDALMFVAAYMDLGDDGGWQMVSGSQVATDGTYAVDLPEPGDYRIVVYDDACVYGQAFYDGVTDLDDAKTIPVSQDATVAGIDVTVTPLPENIISGKVSFVGGDAPSGDYETGDLVQIYSLQYTEYDDELGDWLCRSVGILKPDGTYRLHLPEPGSYRVGFRDFSRTFSDVYYHDALSADEATDVVVPSPEESQSGMDQTMTAIPSRRISGDDRYGTAVAVSQFGFPDEMGAEMVVLATGQDWPDAVSGSMLASRHWAPLLLTKKDSIPPVVADEIRRLRPYEICIVGGPDSVSLEVEIELRTKYDVQLVWRLAGRDRYETSALVAEQAMKRGLGVASTSPYSEQETPPILVASGEKSPDAMSAAPLAANAWSPVLLVKRDSVPASVQSFLQRHEEDFSSTLIVGGPTTIATATADAFPNWKRIAGVDRYETAAAVASYGVAHFDMNATEVGIASGISFPDGLAAVPVLANSGDPLLFTRPTALSPAAEQFMMDNKTQHTLVFGGEPSVSSDVFEQVLETLAH